MYEWHRHDEDDKIHDEIDSIRAHKKEPVIHATGSFSDCFIPISLDRKTVQDYRNYLFRQVNEGFSRIEAWRESNTLAMSQQMTAVATILTGQRILATLKMRQ